MNPKPLIRVFTDDLLENSVDYLRIGLNIAGHFHLRIEAQNIRDPTFRPRSKSRHNRGSGMVSQFHKGGRSTGGLTEKIDPDTFGRCLCFGRSECRLQCLPEEP